MSNYWKHKLRTKSPLEIAGWIVLGILAITGIAILFGFVVMWLWNWLMPEIFGLTTITYWQAVGLFILAKFIFGGFGGSSDNSSCEPKSKKEKNSKNDFSKWRLYDSYWKEEGESAYEEYIKKRNHPITDTIPEEN
ncbi:hypothetical protein [Polaribacter gochangensis]|uniref:hypothetical protein n=1 Tax=Polaribacter gochangensis TaxID=3252903 RepID=UPI003904CDE8